MSNISENLKDLISKELEVYLNAKENAKQYFTSMQEISSWLKEQSK